MTTEFAEEARSRAARLLRMAATADERVRARIVAYAEATPEPPVMGPAGICTAGCPCCRRTMWRQRDGWVCAGCGHLVERMPEKCPKCQVRMKPSPAEGWFNRLWCPGCGRVAASGESTTEIERRERSRREAVRMLERAVRRGDPGTATCSWHFSSAYEAREQARATTAAGQLPDTPSAATG